ncbi:MAG: hypothetical protein WC052_01365 [Patescibacteria group bacterium]
MNTIEDLIGMIFTAAAEEGWQPNGDTLMIVDPIIYRLKLVVKPDGTMVWEDD